MVPVLGRRDAPRAGRLGPGDPTELTARDILGADAGNTLLIVQELGFANIAMGALAVIGAFVPAWWIPAAIPGGVFLGQAGMRHVAKRDKGLEERVATWTDLLVAAAMIVFVARIAIT